MTITALPSLDRTSATFAADLDAFFLTELPAFSVSAEAARVEINAAADAAADSAALVDLAYAASNYKGPWSALTGALARPASVTHGGNWWALAADLADVTAATPGVSASWVPLNVGAGGTSIQSSAVDITLTVASNRMQVVTMTAADKSVILPSASTLLNGVGLYSFNNAGSYTYAVRDAAGGLVLALDPGRSATVNLLDNSTSAGVWLRSCDTVVLDAFVQAVATAVTASAVGYVDVVAMTATTALAVWNASGYPTACLLTVSGSTVSAGTPGAVGTASVNALMSVTRMSNTQAIICWTAITTSYPTAATLNVSGTTVTAGAAFTVNSYLTTFTSVTPLSATQAIIVYSGTSTYGLAKTLNISGTTITGGAECIVFSSASQPGWVAGLSATTAICGFVASGILMYGFVLTVSGTTITAGAGQTLGQFTAAPVVAVPLSATRVLIYGNAYTTTNTPRTALLELSGSTILALAYKDGTGHSPGGGASLSKASETKAWHLTALSGGNASSVQGSIKAQVRAIRIADDDIQLGESRTIKNSFAYVGKGAGIAVLSETLAVVAYCDANNYLQARALEIAA